MLLKPFQPLRARWRFRHLPSQSSGIHAQLGTPTNSDPLLPLIPATLSPSVSMKIYPSSTNRFATRLRVKSGQFRLPTSTRLLAPCRSQDMSQHMCPTTAGLQPLISLQRPAHSRKPGDIACRYGGIGDETRLTPPSCPVCARLWPACLDRVRVVILASHGFCDFKKSKPYSPL
ncbi:hypothetical protein BGZ61DRAFT_29090 [Ilyonectria robusta]|uniref:uncharacterized protein n=1 Tax=Ilyonectria robusta TaxID=1079257 RepID=UPI001E8E5CF0|nr:uncharacterized protein BGZ61DRAFT_29090 [Ilyonectria robusta]KAH8738187.1 hypothetical protein BGZ61DRAFT_29090 [Ilyonectria robusta]